MGDVLRRKIGIFRMFKLCATRVNVRRHAKYAGIQSNRILRYQKWWQNFKGHFIIVIIFTRTGRVLHLSGKSIVTRRYDCFSLIKLTNPTFVRLK
jgi:hypothetical protein